MFTFVVNMIFIIRQLSYKNANEGVYMSGSHGLESVIDKQIKV
jgi:hypothetical protein